jgi:hypothetical protein
MLQARQVHTHDRSVPGRSDARPGPQGGSGTGSRPETGFERRHGQDQVRSRTDRGGVRLLGIVFGVAVSDFSTASDVTAVVGSVTTVVGTIIGAFFGVQAGAAGKEAAEAGRTKAEAGRAQAENAARVALAHLDPAAATGVMKLL